MSKVGLPDFNGCRGMRIRKLSVACRWVETFVSVRSGLEEARTTSFSVPMSFGVVFESIQYRSMSRVLSEIMEIQGGIALTWEEVWHPAEVVVKVPEGNANARFGLSTSASNLVVEVLSLSQAEA